MNKKIKNLIFLICAGGILFLIPIFYAKDRPIEVNMPILDTTNMAVHEVVQQQTAQAEAHKRLVSRIYRCQQDDDCIIVDKDPCGCLVGPKGVTAINAEQTEAFDRTVASSSMRACPDTAPSTERECSPSAYAVCRAGACKIEY